MHQKYQTNGPLYSVPDPIICLKNAKKLVPSLNFMAFQIPNQNVTGSQS
jgi:hypothetical protein